MPAVLQLNRLGQIAMPVRDLARATAFYRDILGLPFLFAAPQLAFFDCDGLRLMLGVPESDVYDHPGSILYFNVDDIHAADAALRAASVTMIDAPHIIATLGGNDVWMVFFYDTEGNTLALMSEQPTAFVS